MTEQKNQDTPRDVDWDRAQSVIKARILAMREKQAAEAKARHSA